MLKRKETQVGYAMIEARITGTQTEVEVDVAKYFERYQPAGYDTHETWRGEYLGQYLVILKRAGRS